MKIPFIKNNPEIMTKNLNQWLSIYLLPYSFLVIATLFTGKGLGGASLDNIGAILGTIFAPIIAAPFLALLGYGIGFFSNVESAPFYTTEFKIALFACLIVSIVLFVYGIKKRDKLWGKIINASGFYLWCIGGIISLAPAHNKTTNFVHR